MIVLYVILAVLVLLLMITIHEAGHYTAGKLLGFGITEFSVGLGPRLFSYRRVSGELISVRALPLGGYCAFYGEDDAGSALTGDAAKDTAEGESAATDTAKGESAATECKGNMTPAESVGESCAQAGRSLTPDEIGGESCTHAGRSLTPAESVGESCAQAGEQKRKVPFDEQPPWKRIIVLLMGPLFNLFSAFVFSFIYILAVGYSVPVVTDLSAAAQQDGALRAGDVIVAVDGHEVTFLTSAAELMAEVPAGESATLTVERDGVRVDVTASKSSAEEGGTFGITAGYENRRTDVLHAAGYSFPYTFELSWIVLKSFGMLFTGGVPITDVTGPVGTVATIATFAQTDFRYFLLFLPLIASNLAIFNLLPIPALDGSRIVFTVIEMIRRKPINKKTEGTIHAVGLIILLAFVIVVDIVGMIARGLS